MNLNIFQLSGENEIYEALLKKADAFSGRHVFIQSWRLLNEHSFVAQKEEIVPIFKVIFSSVSLNIPNTCLCKVGQKGSVSEPWTTSATLSVLQTTLLTGKTWRNPWWPLSKCEYTRLFTLGMYLLEMHRTNCKFLKKKNSNIKTLKVSETEIIAFLSSQSAKC